MSIRERFADWDVDRRAILLVLVVLLVLLGTGLGTLLPSDAPDDDSPTADPTPTPTATPTPTPTATQMAGGGVGPDGATESPPSTPEPTATATPEPSEPVTPGPTESDPSPPSGPDTPTTPTQTPTDTASPTETPAQTPTPTETPTETATGTPTPDGPLDGPSSWTPIDTSDVLPGDDGSETVTLGNDGDEDGALRISSVTVIDRENGTNDPESDVDDTPNEGELSEHLEVRIAFDDPAGGETYLLGTSDGYVPLADLEGEPSADHSLADGDQVTARVDWRIPLETGNVIQSDEVDFELGFDLSGAGG